ncbi:hypothetical protein [Halalkalibacter sp. APA_J-10(15)]|uniref:hypothetical protein n=1 Tax=unclassified Halalkalibacter TaxID=2893063 RepID=UPI001FF13BB7|nr:hypothetical protein [Halalkalibacter sp. APA_J-10(15)]MCK0472462.1 hypothetical protein [Halalkalibacter sp. APA_J-10(15)]
MTSFILWLLFYVNFVLIGITFGYLYNKRKLIGYHLGMNLAMTPTGLISIVTGLILIYHFPFHFTEITIFTTIIGIGIGVLFGTLVEYQTVIMGITSGVMSGIMAPMIGDMAQHSLVLIGFAQIIVFIVMGMLCYSLRS